MNESFVSLAFLIGVPAIIVALVVVTRGSRPRPPPRERVKRPDELFPEAFATDPDYVYAVLPGPFGYHSRTLGWTVSSRSGHPALSLEAMKVDIPGDHWVITATPAAADGAPLPPPLLVGRTTLVCSREGLLGAIENALGLDDVETGDPRLDDQVSIVGSDRDVVRAVVRQPPVMAALTAIFLGNPLGMRCELDRRGHLTVAIYRSELSADEARRCLGKVRALWLALEAASTVEPIALVEPSDVGSVASSSGAPVGFGGSLPD